MFHKIVIISLEDVCDTWVFFPRWSTIGCPLMLPLLSLSYGLLWFSNVDVPEHSYRKCIQHIPRTMRWQRHHLCSYYIWLPEMSKWQNHQWNRIFSDSVQKHIRFIHTFASSSDAWDSSIFASVNSIKNWSRMTESCWLGVLHFCEKFINQINTHSNNDTHESVILNKNWWNYRAQHNSWYLGWKATVDFIEFGRYTSATRHM